MTDRSLTVTWEDPMIGASAAMTMSGLDYLRAVMTGAIPPPPIMKLINFHFTTIEKGHVIFEIMPAEYHCNPMGTIHGGIACTILDSVTGCAVHSTLPAGTGHTSLEIKVNFTRVITVKTGLLKCEGNIIHAGRQIATSEGRITDMAGNLYAHAVSTCMIFQPSK